MDKSKVVVGGHRRNVEEDQPEIDPVWRLSFRSVRH